MSEQKNGNRGRRRGRSLSAEEKLQIWLQPLSGEFSQRQAAERWEVDPTTIVRIRRVARAGALSALAQSRPGVREGAEDAELAAARAEIARLEETVKEQAIELVALRGNSARAGRRGPGRRRRRRQAGVAGAARAGRRRGLDAAAGVPSARS